MKKNIFGLPIVANRLRSSEAADKVFFIVLGSGLHMTFMNDLSKIAITRDKLERLDSSFSDVPVDECLHIVCNLAAMFCGVRSEALKQEQVDSIIECCAYASSFDSFLRDFHINLKRECVEINGVGFSIKSESEA